MTITADLLVAAMGCSRERAAVFAPHLDAACGAYQINTPARLAAFLAQIGHESGALRHTTEVWGPTDAQKRYEGRADLGNTQPGDGSLFRGHGLIQTTGRANHRSVRDRLRARGHDAPDFEAAPHLLSEPQWAAWSAADYWDMRGLNALADAGNFEGITRKINGGLNGQADRLRRWEMAKTALDAGVQLGPEPPAYTPPRPDQEPYTQEASMPIPAIVGALLPTLIDSIPKLGKLFGSGSAVAERNVAAATMAMEIAKQAVNATNEQEAVTKIAADPAAQKAAAQAIESHWFELAESGGGGIDGARKADAATVAAEGRWPFLRSPSFWMLVLSLPLVYIIVGSVVGLWGHTGWSDDVRASLATAVVSLIVGGSAGYFWGQTTSRNRTPAEGGRP